MFCADLDDKLPVDNYRYGQGEGEHSKYGTEATKDFTEKCLKKKNLMSVQRLKWFYPHIRIDVVSNCSDCHQTPPETLGEGPGGVNLDVDCRIFEKSRHLLS